MRCPSNPARWAPARFFLVPSELELLTLIWHHRQDLFEQSPRLVVSCPPHGTDTPTVLWTLRNGHRRRECSVQLLPHGLQLHLALNGDTPYCSRTFHTQDELLAWAEEQRVQNVAEG